MNILITRHDKIGDFCTALPMLKVLKKQTNHKLFVLVSKINYEFAKNFDFIDEVLLYEEKPLELNKKIDVSISAFIDTKLGINLLRSGIKTRIAPATKIAQIFFNKRVKQRRSKVLKSEWEYNLELLKAFDNSLDITFTPPLLNFGFKRENITVFHPGFGGSSDGNLTIDEYIKLAKSVKDKTKVIFTFGPSDMKAKKYIKANTDFDIKDNFFSLWEFTKFLATINVFVSTSTGPMHLASLSNTKTLSFFGNTKFASYKRWKPESSDECQKNFLLPTDFDIIVKSLKEMI
jgi:ADP-heptose:LPS heptosyltransferase